MFKNIPLVEEITEIKTNIITLNNALKSSDTELIELLKAFKHWYYFEDLDLFGPSKFIGYQDMDSKKYLEYHRKIMDGRDTEDVLNQHFLEVERDTDEWALLFTKLKSLLYKFDKAPRKNVVIKKYNFR